MSKTELLLNGISTNPACVRFKPEATEHRVHRESALAAACKSSSLRSFAKSTQSLP
jgi:hypothetical protein